MVYDLRHPQQPQQLRYQLWCPGAPAKNDESPWESSTSKEPFEMMLLKQVFNQIFFDVLQSENDLIRVFLSELVAEIIIVRVFLYTHPISTKKEMYNAIYRTPIILVLCCPISSLKYLVQGGYNSLQYYI
jgi:hypothetical protein